MSELARSIDEATVPIASAPELASFLRAMTGSFENQMKTYCEFLSVYPQHKATIESLPQIPMAIKQYYNILGPDELRAMSYLEANIRRRIDEMDMMAQVREAAKQAFISNQFYSLQEVKSKLQAIYNRLGITRTAKATDLDVLIECAPKKMTVEGKRKNGYWIL